MGTEPADSPAFWDVRFRAGDMPWDTGRVPHEVERFLAGERAAGRVLIPGCGSGYEIAAFAARGWDVVAVDFSEAAVERARSFVGAAHAAVVLGDFFSHDFGDAFDVIYERAFLCALPPRLWNAWGERVAALAKPGGRLAGYFLHGGKRGGPPYFMAPGRQAELLADSFEKIDDVPVAGSLPVFLGGERWEVWRRR